MSLFIIKEHQTFFQSNVKLMISTGIRQYFENGAWICFYAYPTIDGEFVLNVPVGAMKLGDNF